MNYCISVWGNTYDSYLEPLIKLQKRAIRVVVGAKRYSHTDPIFKRLRILKLRQIYVFSVQLFVFKYYHELLPSIFDDFFTRNRSFHAHSTRSRDWFRPPLFKSAIAKRIIRVTGVRTHNYFESRLNINCSYLSYKVALKIFLIDNETSII